MDLQLEGRIALVTGSWRGTGRGIARVLAAEGATVLVHGFEDGQADAAVAGIEADGGRALPVAGDLRSDAGAERVARAAEAAGPVDILVNNYGVAEGGSWRESSSQDWIDLYQKNVLSGVRLVHLLSPGMAERGHGRIVFLGTIGSLQPNARMPHYYASKGAVANLTVSLARELAGTGVTVNCVSPGLIATDEVRQGFLAAAERRGLRGSFEEIEPEIVARRMPNPCGRTGRVEEVGALVAFLASPLAAYVNAANLRIDGGASGTAV